MAKQQQIPGTGEAPPSALMQARILAEALPHMQRYDRQTVVVTAAHNNPFGASKTIPINEDSTYAFNGNGVSGAAGTEATQLLARGYRHAAPGDAPTTYAQSVALFRPGWQREAQRLARDVGIRAVTPLDVRLPGSERGYQVVLILGAN